MQLLTQRGRGGVASMGSEGRPACGRKSGRMCSRARKSRERSIKLSRLAPEGENVRHEARGCGKKREGEAEPRRCGSRVDNGLMQEAAECKKNSCNSVSLAVLKHRDRGNF